MTRHRMQRWSLAAVVLALAGCPMIKGSGSGASTMPTPAPAGSAGPSGEPQPTASAGPAASGPSAGAAAPAPSGNGQLTVPNLIGKTRDEARALVKAAGFSHEMESTRPVACEGAAEVPGLVNCQDPEAGKAVARYTIIQVNVHEKRRIAGAIVRSELQTLVGLTPDQARVQLKKLGHTGPVVVEPLQTYDANCGENKVCPYTVNAGIAVSDRCVLWINPKLTIAPPPD